MKKTWILLLPLLIATASMAQPAGDPGGRHRQPARTGQHQPFKHLQLTPAQQTQVRQLQAQLKKDLQELRKNESITVKEQRDQREQLMKNHRQAMQQLLTPAQQQQLQALRSSRQTVARHRSAILLEQLKTRLQLTDAQVAALQANQEKMQSGMQALRSNQQLDRVARQQKMEALRSEMKADMEKVLTQEQLRQMRNHLPPHRGRGGAGYGPGRGMHMGR